MDDLCFQYVLSFAHFVDKMDKTTELVLEFEAGESNIINPDFLLAVVPAPGILPCGHHSTTP